MSRRVAIGLWLAFIAFCSIVIARTSFTADLSAFLPRAPSAEQQLLVDQLKDGVISRLLLGGIEGGDAAARAAVSKAMARQLRGHADFAAVSNGEPIGIDRDREILFGHRYLLSPAVTPERFTPEGLRTGIAETIDLLASPAGLLVKSLIPRDPTGEIVSLLDQIDAGTRPALSEGVWISHDRKRALLLFQTRVNGTDTDGQERALATIRDAFESARQQLAPRHPQVAETALQLTGTGVFAVKSRATIKHEVELFAILGTALIAGFLLLIYRSPTALVLGLLPVASGALAGVTAVSLGFGTVHGLTLGFGTTLIGEAVDYSIYLFIQSENARDNNRRWQGAFWPTIRLGVLTSIGGFAALLFSGFPGLAQLGLYSVAGLLAAALVTRFVLPHLLPPGFRVRDVSAIGTAVQAALRAGQHLRWALVVVIVAAAVVLLGHRDTLWNHELGGLSPVPDADQALDARLRADLGAPDIRYLVVVSAADHEGALIAAEAAGERLRPLIEANVISGYDSPARFLPSQRTQEARRAAIPDGDTLRRALTTATETLPVQASRFGPFLDDAAQARHSPLLSRSDLDGSNLALAVDALLLNQGPRVTALLPLRSPTHGPSAHAIDPARVRAAISGLNGVLFVDLKGESNRLYAGYLQEAILLSLSGALAIVALLAIHLRSPRRLLRVITPLVAAVLVVIAALALADHKLTILHLVGMLLIVAVGSNYALFFDEGASAGQITPKTLASLVIANLTTVTGFGLLAFSSVPVLQAIGITVGPGAILALVFSAILAAPTATRRHG